jgi:cytochrome c5
MRPGFKVLLLIIVIISAILISGCAQTKPTPIVTAPQPTTGNSSNLDGKTLVETRCTVCHSIDRITSKKATLDGWQTTVSRMIGKGAQLTAEEESVLVKYLADIYK